MERKIEITFTEEGNQVSSSSVMDKNLTVYSVVIALESLIEGLRYKMGEYIESNDINPQTKDFAKIIQSVKIENLQ